MHPLHTPEMVAAHVLSTGEYFDKDRCTGRTERLALRALHTAMNMPNQWHRLVDHHSTRPAHQELRRRVQSLVARLTYKGFTFRDVEVCFGTPPDLVDWP